uniref:Uncharacterized protein n=1 Tax=Anopheles funestus TaxID=62324 RepID=A0A182RAP9_ANOFN
MSSKEKRSSILKKHEKVPSCVGRVSTVASVPSTFKSNRKIEFHRKKSIKEFVVGEDVDTIWGNSYEVSTDGSPSNELEDATLANSTCRSTTDEQNKENQSVNQHLPVDNSWRHNSLNAPNTSWDLSITIADDEKRKIRNETSAVFSHSLNTTERLLVEPYAEPKASSDKVKISLQVENSDVHAMDISPIKPNINPSPRKMIYTFPKQAMFVEINDIPDEKQAELKLKDASLTAHQREQPKSSIRSSWRTGTSVTGSQSLLGGCSYNVSETWNSHPHAMYQQCAETRVSGELANVSSDVDTTIALTNAMTKVLQSRSNESIQKATNMELDESTTTLPTNALARARPSFLPSNQRPVDESQDGLDRTPINFKREENIPLPTGRSESTQSADISSPVEGHSQRISLSLDNLSILADMKQAVTDEENENKLRPSAENKHEDVPMNFGLSSLSLNLRPSSPETPVVVKPRILRPTLPIGMLETAKDHSETKKTDTKDEYDRIRSVKRTPGMVSSQKLKGNSEDKKETDAAGKKSLVPMDISMGIRRHTNKPSLASMHSRMTVDMVESPKQSQNNRATIYHSLDIDIDRMELPGKTEKQSHRATVLHGEEMELTTHVPATVQSSTNAARRTNCVEEPVLEETARIHHSSEPTTERMKRGTVLGSMPIDESTDCPPCSPQTALNNYRKTVYPLDRMKEDASVIAVTNGPDRKTILCNESMILDVCPTPKASSGFESSISCVVYGRNVDELSIHATQGNNAVDMKFARPTIFQLESCDESAHVAPGRQTVMQEQNMIISEGATSGKTSKQRLTTHVAHAMEEDETFAVSCEKKNGTTPSLKDTRKSMFNSEEMELTLVQESNPKTLSERPNAGMECMDLYKTQVEESKGHAIQTHQQSRIPRLTTYLREDMHSVQHEESKPRYTIYEREDMDVTKLHRSTTTATEDYQDDRSHVKLEEDKKKESKPRFSIYEHEPMNATNICEDYFDQGRNTMQNEYRSVCETHSKSVRVGLIDMEIEQAVKQNEPKARITVAHTGCADVGEEMQNDVTNYNTFLEHHEMSHGTQLQGLSTIHQTDHLQDKAFNSTRLSKAYERENLSTSVIPSRMSSYRLEAMDETNIAGQTPSTDAVQTPFSEKKISSNDRFDSPMQMSPLVGNCRDKTTLQHNSRKSSYHPEAMESTPTGQKKADADRKTCIESFGLRKSDLQRIALESDPVDMEGISVLESDPTDSKLEKYVTGTAQEANYFASCNTKDTKQPQESIMHAVVVNKEKGQPNSRLSIYDPTAMVEETVAINIFRLKQEQTSALDRHEGVTSRERKSNDCMDETIVPENIRVERDVRFTRQSRARVGSIVKDSPVLYIAEHPPIIDQHQPNTQGTLYGTEETMELTTALSKVKKSVIEKRNRQTIHQPDDMNLTMVGKDTLTPPPCVQRKTIYNLGSMDETPPHIDFNVANNRGSLVEPVQQPIIAERRSHRRPRQTILISQDMDLEKEEEEEQHGEGQQSFALAMLPRESTEDRVPRSASILPKRTFFQEPSIDAYSEVTKPGPEMVRQSSHTIDRKLVTRTDTSAFKAHEISDISLTTTTMEPEIPCIGNITGMMSMREITQPLALASFQEQSHSVSVICRVDGQAVGPSFVQEQHDLQTMAFVPTRQNGASDDEFYDAEDDAASEPDLVVDPLSLTKSRHLTMKFIDVGHLEQTNCDTTAPAPAPTTASKRVHAQVLGTPVINRTAEHEYDPLQMTHARQTLRMDVEQTPQSPIKKRPRTSCANPAPEETNITAKHPAEQPSPIEEVLIKEERQSRTNPDRASQTLIHDPSVFLMEEENLLDDESNLPCASLNEEPLPDTDDCFNQSSKPPGVITEQSYYKNFANLTIDTFDSYDEEQLTPAPDNVDEPIQHDTAAPEANDLVAECISVSDEDSLIVTPPKVPLSLAYNGGNRLTDEVLDSTIASKIMYQIRQKHPVVKHPCCGMQTECLCRLRAELQRHQEMSDLVWNRWCSKYQTIKQRIPKLPHQTASTDPQGDEEKPPVRVTFEEQIEELNWRLLRTQVDDDFFFVKGELSREDVSRRRSRTISSGHYPETPSAVFLADNYRSYLSEQLYADNSPPSGAPMPRIPRITQLIANKLSFDTGTRWLLDCSEDNDGMLLLRHRTLRSFVISIQLQPPRGKTRSVRNITESWRLERIQVRECMEEYVHSSKLLLAHVEFMRLAKETTERTLRSTYRTVADLMGLWHHFHELIQRVFDGVNRLVAIVRNNDAMLCYDAQMERFYVKKCVHRALDDEVNTLQIHFNWIESIGVSGVNFKWPKAEHNKLLPAGTNQHTTAPGNFMQGVGTNEKTGLMFLECLLWNVTKHYET